MTGAGPEPIQMGRGKPGWRSRLTPRLRRVAALLADGYTNAAIARRLGLEAGAVRKDVAALYRLAGLDARDAERNPRVVLAVRLQNAMARERERERRAQRDQRQPAATGMEGERVTA